MQTYSYWKHIDAFSAVTFINKAQKELGADLGEGMLIRVAWWLW